MKRVLIVFAVLALALLGGCRKADPLPAAQGTQQSAAAVTRMQMGSNPTATLLPSSTPFPTATRMPSLTPLPPGTGACPGKNP